MSGDGRPEDFKTLTGSAMAGAFARENTGGNMFHYLNEVDSGEETPRFNSTDQPSPRMWNIT